MIFVTCVTSLLLGASFNTKFSYRTLYLSTIANTRNSMSQMPNMYYCGLQSSRKIFANMYWSRPFLPTFFCKKKCMQEGAWSLYIFFQSHKYQGSTGKFIYKASILRDKQLLSNMIDCKPTKVSCIIRIAFLADSYIFCSNFLASLYIIAIASYIAVWRQHFWTETQSS